MARRRQPEPESRLVHGRVRPDARFPIAPPQAALPEDYAAALAAIKSRIQEERLRVVLSANAAMVLLYWDIGRMILARQERAGWGAKVIDRLAADLREAFPEMKGFSPRNLKYMRAFAAAWPERAIVQRVIAQLPWRQNLALLERLGDPATRLWYAAQTLRSGWSQPILCMQIDARAHERQGKALTNFAATLPPGESDLAAQVFKDLLEDEARREAAEGAGWQPTERRGDRSGAVAETEAEGERDEVVKLAEDTERNAAIAANLKELGYGG